MRRIRSPFRPLAEPDFSVRHFLRPLSRSRLLCPLLNPIGICLSFERLTRGSTLIFCVPLVRLPPCATQRKAGRELVQPGDLIPASVRESLWPSRGTPQLLSTRNCRIYILRRTRMVRTSDCVAPSSPCNLPPFSFCTSARVFASGLLHPALTEPNSAFRYPSHHPARG